MSITADFEKGTNGASISTSDAGSATAWNSVAIGDSGTPAYDNTHAAHGSLAAKFIQSGTTGPNLVWSTAFGTQTDCFGRIYLFATANPSANARIVVTKNSGTASLGIRLSTTGKLLMLNGGAAVGSASTNSVALNQWVRIEYHFTYSAAGAGAIEVKLFNTADSTTATETISTSALTTAASANSILVGNDQSVTWTFWMDDIVAAATSYPGPAVASAPVNTVAPAVTGTATVGSTLTTDNGTWTDDGSPTFSYQWQRDVAGNGVYSDISSATSSTYTLVSADDTCHVRCVVTDSTPDGNTSANSNATAIVTFATPVNSVAPTVSGNTAAGSTLTNDNGTWSGSPTSYGYQWTSDGTNIASATNSTYTTVSGDIGHAIGVKVTATNDGGTASAVASSNTITVVTAPSLSTVAGKTGTSGTAVMQKAKSGWTYITGKKNTSGTAVDQKGLGGFTKIKGH